MNRSRAAIFFGLLFAGLLAARLCHSGILWTEEGLPLAAAVQMLHGKTLYQEAWYDKPPLVPAIYLLWGAHTGWPLRVAGALYALLACWLIYRFAKGLWSDREGFAAAGLLAFFLTFDLPSSVLPLAADLLTLAPHIAAVWLAWKNRPLASGAAAGVAFLCNPKAVFVLAACALWQYRRAPRLLAGFLLPNAAAIALLAAAGALGDYYDQVWRLGRIYASHTFIASPVREGVARTLNWLGFHAALAAGALWFFWRDRHSDRARLAVWAALSLVAVVMGLRFFPRYYFHLLPALTLAGARGFAMLGQRGRVALALLLLVPLARFGPRYVMLAAGAGGEWGDVAMDEDSRAASRLVLDSAQPGETLFVWGYRPDIYAYTRMPAGARFLESQPLTGVFADRHLAGAGAAFTEWAAENRRELARSRPNFVLDGLAAYNPALAIQSYPDLTDWFTQYELVGRTKFTLMYRLRREPISRPNTARASRETPQSPPARRRPGRSSS